MKDCQLTAFEQGDIFKVSVLHGLSYIRSEVLVIFICFYSKAL